MSQAPTTPASPSQAPRDVAAVQARYANRIKARLAQPSIDAVSARDGILDCFVATYFGGLKHGIAGYLGIDAREEQVAQVAQQLFKKRLVAHGSSFESPSVDALDKVKNEVDKELHFHDLPGELRGLHDQVCSLMLSKADGTLAHDGDRSAVRASSGPAVAKPSAPRKPAPPASQASSGQPTGIQAGLRDALAGYLDEYAEAARSGASPAELRARMGKLEKLVDVLEEFAS